jgi:hypothetical protein
MRIKDVIMTHAAKHRHLADREPKKKSNKKSDCGTKTNSVRRESC